jgi:hypothetical protein
VFFPINLCSTSQSVRNLRRRDAWGDGTPVALHDGCVPEDAMFDLITGRVQHVPSTPAIPILISTSVQGTVFAVLVLASFLVATRELPPVPDMMSFAAELPAVAPPPPPPPAAPPQSQPRPATPTAAPVSAAAAPIEAPASIEPEPPAAVSMEEGVPGGVPGGIAAGIVGGIPSMVAGPRRDRIFVIDDL